MERDTILAHGLSAFLHEKYMDRAEQFVLHICDICGGFADRIKT